MTHQARPVRTAEVLMKLRDFYCNPKPRNANLKVTLMRDRLDPGINRFGLQKCFFPRTMLCSRTFGSLVYQPMTSTVLPKNPQFMFSSFAINPTNRITDCRFQTGTNTWCSWGGQHPRLECKAHRTACYKWQRTTCYKCRR